MIILPNLAAEERPFRILCIDSGGVRGIIPAVILGQMEEDLQRPIHEVFDMVAGSSTGGIIALSLATQDLKNPGKPNYQAQEVVNLYINNSNDIFNSSFLYKLTSLGGLLGPKYESSGLLRMLKDKLGDTMLSQTLIPVLLTGYHLESQTGIEFFSEEARKHPHKDCLLTEVGLATAATPIYFEPVDVNYSWGTLKSVADGGIYRQNPSLLALTMAKKLSNGRKIEIYSLGTGIYSAEEIGSQFKGRGLLQWLSRILGHLSIGGTEADNTMLHRLLNEDGEQNYFRINVNLGHGRASMDDISKKNIRYLYAQGLSVINTPIYAAMIERLRRF